MIKFLHSKLLLSLTLFVAFAFSSMAQITVEEYYQSATGKTGSELKTSLHNIIKGHTELPYTSSDYDVWDALKETDEDPNDDTKVLLIYTGRSEAKSHQDNGSGDDDSWNREHIWAKSHGDFGTDPGAGTDIHHLRPCDRSVNSDRSNLFFDDGGVANSEATECFSDEDSWEPRNAVKGDVARMILYMAVRYEGEGDEPDLEMTDDMSYSKDDYTKPFFGKLTTLKAWNKADPVDDAELARNEKIYTIQGNRNPFIDHPEWVEEVWTTVVDTESPEITELTPANEEENVSSTIDLKIKFNEDVQAGTGNITIKKYSDDNEFEIISSDSDRVTYTSNIVEVDLASELEAGVKYYVTIDNAAIIDASSNTFEGISDKSIWNFTTYIDTESPKIVELSPSNEEDAVSLTANLTITFNEDIKAGSGNITIKRFDTDQNFETIDISSNRLTISNKKLTIDPETDFKEGVKYYVIIENGAITDASSNTFDGISDKNQWYFTTTSTPPSIVAVSPEDGSESVSIDTDLEITFDKGMQAGNGQIFIYSDGNIVMDMLASVAATFTGEYVTIDLPEDLNENTEYYVIIDENAFIGANGEAFEGIDSDTYWTFTTELPTGINDFNAANGPSFYPNPAVNEIRLTNMENVESMHISNLTGRNIMEIKSPDSRIYLNNIPKGMYFVTFITKDGNRVTKKLLKR